MAKSVYIHIPFCSSKCKYCSFVSFVGINDFNNYCEALITEIKSNYKNEILKTLYIGGGTPSLLPINMIGQIISNFNIADNTEITFEINPENATQEYLKGLKNLGINRLSIGSQTFDDDILKIIGRKHNSTCTIKAILNAQSVDFENISIDLMYGLPTQTIQNIEKDLSVIEKINLKHISTYGLKIEQPSYFSKHKPDMLPDDDIQADMYTMIVEYLNKLSFMRYEISNFAQKGFESHHNINYWKNSEYYGFGAGAHGYLDGNRYSNQTNLAKYINNPTIREVIHKQSYQETLEEEIFLGFRLEEGINTELINRKFNINFDNKYKKIISKYMPDYITKTKIGYKLTTKGILLSNIILSEFIN